MIFWGTESMNFWTAMVVIIAIVSFSAMRIARYHAGLGDPPSRRALRGLAGETLPPARETELRRDIEKLHQRVAVLERIATEDRHSQSVAAEIERLRDS